MVTSMFDWFQYYYVFWKSFNKARENPIYKILVVNQMKVFPKNAG